MHSFSKEQQRATLVHVSPTIRYLYILRIQHTYTQAYTPIHTLINMSRGLMCQLAISDSNFQGRKGNQTGQQTFSYQINIYICMYILYIIPPIDIYVWVYLSVVVIPLATRDSWLTDMWQHQSAPSSRLQLDKSRDSATNSFGSKTRTEHFGIVSGPYQKMWLKPMGLNI